MSVVDGLRTAAALLPASRLKNGILRLLGYDVAASAQVAPILLLRVDGLTLKDGAHIGPFNVLRDINFLELGIGAGIGQWNWISAARPLREIGGPGRLTLGDRTSITSRHYLDCSGGIALGDNTVVAGANSIFITHGIDWVGDRGSVGSIIIGKNCILSAGVRVAPNASVADRVIVGMGAIVAGALSESNALYVSPKAEVKRRGLSGRYILRP